MTSPAAFTRALSDQSPSSKELRQLGRSFVLGTDRRIERIRSSVLPFSVAFSSIFKGRFPLAVAINDITELTKLTRKDISTKEKMRIVGFAALSSIALFYSIRTGKSLSGVIAASGTANLGIQTYNAHTEQGSGKSYDL